MFNKLEKFLLGFSPMFKELSEKHTELQIKNQNLENHYEKVKILTEMPEIDNYYQNNELQLKYRSFESFWKAECSHKYLAYNTIGLAKHPKILQNLILAVANFDFEDTIEYMKATNWTWGSDNYFPTTVNMIETIFELAKSSINSDDTIDFIDGKSTVMSGGFSVTLFENNEVLIKFEK